MDSGISAGLEGSAFYTKGHFHIGTRVLTGWQNFTNSKDILFGLFSIPLVIGVNF
jgi:hypothetical protein